MGTGSTKAKAARVLVSECHHTMADVGREGDGEGGGGGEGG